MMVAGGMMVAGADRVAGLLVAKPGGCELLRVAVTSKVSVAAKSTVKVAEAGQVAGLLAAAKLSLAVAHTVHAAG